MKRLKTKAPELVMVLAAALRIKVRNTALVRAMLNEGKTVPVGGLRFNGVFDPDHAKEIVDFYPAHNLFQLRLGLWVRECFPGDESYDRV